MAETGFDAQKLFLANVEDAIASPVDIPRSIARYQKTLQYASTPLDFVFGIGLYLAPSDMAPHPGNVQGYNNEIVIAGSEAAIAHNSGINESEQISGTGTSPSKEKSQHQPGLITRDHRVANPQLMLRSNGVMLLMLRSNGVKNNTYLVARPRQATKKRKQLSICLWLGPPWFNYWFSFTLAYSRINHEYSSLFIIVINLIFMFLL